MPSGRLWENIASTPLSDETRSKWHRVIHDFIPTYAGTTTWHQHTEHNTRACIQCNDIDRILYRLTTCTATSELWQWTRHRIAAVLCADPRYVMMSPYGRKQNVKLTYGWYRHYVHCVVRNGRSVTLHDYMDFLRRAHKRVKRYRKRTSLCTYLEKCTCEDAYSPRCPFSFNPLESSSLGCPMAMCCNQVENIFVHLCEEKQ